MYLTRHRTPSVHARLQRGTSLLEVLIAVLILGIGMLGMAALQSTTLKNSASSASRTQAVIQTYSLLDMLRLDREQANNGKYNVSSWSCGSVTAGTGDTNDYSVFNGWIAGVKSSLDPSACAKVVCATDAQAFKTCTVDLRWNDSRASNGKVSSDDTFNVQTKARL